MFKCEACEEEVDKLYPMTFIGVSQREGMLVCKPCYKEHIIVQKVLGGLAIVTVIGFLVIIYILWGHLW